MEIPALSSCPGFFNATSPSGSIFSSLLFHNLLDSMREVLRFDHQEDTSETGQGNF